MAHHYFVKFNCVKKFG